MRAFETCVINLDRSTDRWHSFQRLNAPWMAHVARFSAVDGRAVERRALVERGLIAADLDYSEGALGCFLSHLALWDAALERNRPIVICEDDAIFNRNFMPALQSLELPRDWDFIAWGWNFDSILAFDLLPGISGCLASFDEAAARRGIAAFQAADLRPTLFRVFQYFGSVCYAISPAGAWRLKHLMLPLRPTKVVVPGLGRTLENQDMNIMLNAVLVRMNAYVSFPPLVLTPNDHALSTIARS